MSILALDYGQHKLGLAISFDSKVSHQLTTLSCQTAAEAIEKLREIINEYSVEKIVLGLPLNEKGQIGKSARRVKEFGEALQKEIKTSLLYQNETLSSRQARGRMLKAGVAGKKRSRQEHTFAAQIILQDFLRER